MRASIIYNRATRSPSSALASTSAPFSSRILSSSSSSWPRATTATTTTTVHFTETTCTTINTSSRSMSMIPNNKQRQRATSNDKNLGQTSAPENVIDVASSYMNNIRMKIATTLASSMTEQDRQQLFTSLNLDQDQNHQSEMVTPKKQGNEHDSEEEKEHTMSINEAVAQALAKEASKREQLLEKERKEIMEQAEIAARKRLENDLLLRERQIALQKWEQDLEEEKLMEQQQQQQSNSNNDTSATISHNEEEQEEGDDLNHHPILGKTLIDFGYKRVHVISVKKLAAIPIWEKQRVYRHDRAKAMAKDKLKSLDIGLPGVIALHEGLGGELSIIDGQHRVGMLAILESKKIPSTSTNDKESSNNSNDQLDLDEILVEVFPQKSTSPPSHAQDLFVEINKAEPVKLVDMPGVAKRTDRKIINDAATYLSDTYPDMFKPSQRCRPPHLNIDNLRDAIFASGLLKKHHIKSKSALLKWILEVNGEMGKKYQKETGGSVEVNKNALEKAKKFNFYLGLELSWLHR